MADKKNTKPAPLSTESIKAAPKFPADIDSEAEAAKARGETDSQKEVKAYHEGKFQTHDPVTGLKRDKPLPE